MRILKSLVCAVVLVVLAASVSSVLLLSSGCKAVEEAGEGIEKTADEAGDAAEEVVDEVGDAVREVN
jgi:hypothetical protein